MSIEKPANERLNLYNRFKESLRSGDDSTFFDADDLIIIIDQAVDLQDEYVELEAIMRGYRFFPDNEELNARRAFLYYGMNLEEGVDNVSQTLTSDSPMAQILKIRRLEEGPQNRDKVIAMLDEIANDPVMLTDEEIIQLVDCAGAALCLDWLKANETKLRKKTDYPPTLLYEIFIVADMQGERDYSLKLLEELTELQPFNIDFWNALAQVQADGITPEEYDLDGALNSLEFALAIDSENPDALTLKASILMKQDKTEQALQVIAPVIEKSPSPNAAQIYVCGLITLDRKTEVIEALGRFCREYPFDTELLSLALALPHPDINELLDSHFANNSDAGAAVHNAYDWADSLYRQGHTAAAITLLEFLHSRAVLDAPGYRRLFSALYASGNYDRCIDLYAQLEERTPSFLLTEMILAVIMSYLRKGNKSAAKKAFKEINDRLPMNMTESWTMGTAVESIGMSNFMSAVKAMLNSRGDMRPDLIDIFEFPYNDKE